MDRGEETRPPDPAEVRARTLVQQGDRAAAATTVITAFGPEVLGWLHAVARSEAEGDDAFSVVCERLWTALPTFQWTGSVRTWMYVVARNLLRDEQRRGRRRVELPLSRAPELEALVRSSTAAYRKTDNKDRLGALRAQLDPEDHMLLSLRLDRALPWRDIAEILSGGEADGEELARVAARARKQFARLKERLRRAWSNE